jgi:hypothetical protein
MKFNRKEVSLALVALEFLERNCHNTAAVNQISHLMKKYHLEHVEEVDALKCKVESLLLRRE